MMKNAFYFTLKALDWKDEVNFKIYDVTTWLKNNCNTHIDKYLKK